MTLEKSKSKILESTADDRVIVPKKEILFHGIPVSGGIAIGPVYLLRTTSLSELVKAEDVTEDQIDNEIEQFYNALKGAQSELEESLSAKREAEGDSAAADLLSSHLMMLRDRTLSFEVESTIRRDLVTAQTALKSVVDRYALALTTQPDTYMQERVSDLYDLTRRLLRRMSGLGEEKRPDFEQPTIIMAKELTPSETAMLSPDKILGFATEVGGKNSHTAILARSMGLPAIVGLRNMLNRLNSGDTVIIDGYAGIVIIHPDEQTIAYYQDRYQDKDKVVERIKSENDKPAITKDGAEVRLMANLDTIGSIGEIHDNNADGIGLFRSEYLFMGQKVVPDETTQFEAYRKMAEALNPHPVTIRTLDIGGDKLDFILSDLKEPNPSLGVRAIRLCLDQQQLFRTQLRAILRASAYGKIKLMIPMISCIGEMKQVQQILSEIKADLKKSKIPYDREMKVGAMLEIPSAILIADRLAKYVDFFSIGTNDLVQYTLAVDRGNEKLTNLYEPLHPAVLSLIRRAVEVSKEKGIPISCCGELSSSAKYMPVLLGLGLREFSLTSIRIPFVRWAIRHTDTVEAEKLVERLSAQDDFSKSNDVLLKFIKAHLPEVYTLVNH